MLVNSDLETFQNLFESRLTEMLSVDELGAFILVLANSMQDEYMQQALAPKLAVIFSELKERYQKNTLNGSDDDRLVFEALLKTGIARYKAWQQKILGPWRAAYNPFRALRPQRASREKFNTLKREFDEQGFHFDKPFLKPEIISEECFDDREIRVLYHKFPFVAYHLLILLDPKGHHPQIMMPWSLELAWQLVSRCAERIPGFGLAYNSIGASASVNHLHVHGFIQAESLAIEHMVWRHNGGDRSYPVQCYPARSVEECWQRIEQLHHDNQPYNLLFRSSVCYVIPRPPQGHRRLPDWLPDAGWYELSGGFNLLHSHHFDGLNQGGIEAGMSKLML